MREKTQNTNHSLGCALSSHEEEGRGYKKFCDFREIRKTTRVNSWELKQWGIVSVLSMSMREETQCHWSGEQCPMEGWQHSRVPDGDTTGRHHKRQILQDCSITFNCDSEILAWGLPASFLLLPTLHNEKNMISLLANSSHYYSQAFFIASHCFHGNSTQIPLTLQQHFPGQKYERCLEYSQKIADIKIRDSLIMKPISLLWEA